MVGGAEGGKGMEKTIFLFTRTASRSRENFGQHYVNNHAPLGRRLTRVLRGYTLNLVQNRNWPDAVTEHWVGAAMDLLTPSIAYARRQDFEEVLADDRTLFDAFRLYVVTGEKEVIHGQPLASPVGEVTPEFKVVWAFPDAGAAPAPPPGARRVVDNVVGHELVHMEDGRWERVAADVAVFRMAWAPDLKRIASGDCLIVSEYRQIPSPEPGWEASRIV